MGLGAAMTCILTNRHQPWLQINKVHLIPPLRQNQVRLLYVENRRLGQWFKRSLMVMMKEKTPFAIIKVRSANCTKIAKGGHSDGTE